MWIDEDSPDEPPIDWTNFPADASETQYYRKIIVSPTLYLPTTIARFENHSRIEKPAKMPAATTPRPYSCPTFIRRAAALLPTVSLSDVAVVVASDPPKPV
jgi:hypothetical protein